METRSFGTGGARVAVIGQGTWHLEQVDSRAASAAVHAALDAGATQIDTAEQYGDGAVEEIVGEALMGRRDEAFLVSKVLPRHASYEGTLAACAASLRRLRTDRLDCYLLHWPAPHPLEETFRAFERLVVDGKIRAYGVSNFDERELEAALAITGPGRIACNQVLYHLETRAIEHRVLPWCRRHGVALVAYSPFGSGRFPSARGAGGRVLARIAAAHGASARQVALRFLVRDPSVLAIPMTGDPAHARENAAAADLRLSGQELSAIDAAFPPGPDTGGVPTL